MMVHDPTRVSARRAGVRPGLASLSAALLAAGLCAPLAAAGLPEAIRAAMQADPALASAVANRDVAQENIAITRARLLPQVTVQSTLQRVDQNTKFADNSERDFQGQSQSTQVSIRQAVYRPRDRAGYAVGKLQAEYGELKLRSAEAELWTRTASAWLEVLVAQALRDLYARTEHAVQVTAEQERRRFEAGDGTRDAVAEAAAQLALARAQKAESELTLDARLRAFGLLTGLPAGGFSVLQLPQVGAIPVFPEEEQALLQRVLDTNPELAAAQVGVIISERRLEQASADHRPTLDIVGSANRAQNDTTTTLGARYNNKQIGLQLVVPIYSGGGVNAAERQATATIAAARADRDTAERNLRRQFLADWRGQLGQIERARAALELVQATQEQRKAIEFGIRAGARTWADLGASELLAARRESEYLNLVGAVAQAQARLLSLLPVSDPAWERWTGALSAQSRR